MIDSLERLKTALADSYAILQSIIAKTLADPDGAGHVPPVEVRIPAINDFLDRTLGRVKTR